MTGKYHAAENALTEALASWTGVIERFPADSSAIRSLVFIYADIASLHRQFAATEIDRTAVEKRNGQACDAYRSSIQFIEKMSSGENKIPRRYPWSPDPDTIRNRYQEYCVAGSDRASD